MTMISDALKGELERLLLVRELATCARHAMQAEPSADAVTFNVTFDSDGLQVTVAYDLHGVPLSGWGQ
jgi:hypothetical protein